MYNEITSRYVWKCPDKVLGWTLEAGHYDKRLLPLHWSTPESIGVGIFLLRNEEVNSLKINNLDPIDILL